MLKILMQWKDGNMKLQTWLYKLKGLSNAIIRYSVTTGFLIAIAVINAISIQRVDTYPKLLMSCIVGAMLCATMQAVWERFFSRFTQWIILLLSGVVLTVFYYLIIQNASDYSAELSLRTTIAIIALYMIYSLIPTIKSKVSFNDNFMIIFKAMFQTIFFSVILFGGCSLVIAAFHLLIRDVNQNIYLHTGNIIFSLFGPIYFLSRIPVYPVIEEGDTDNATEQEKQVVNAATCPKFLEVLISYIIIPLTTIYTVILVFYIILNIRGKFWTNNLLEPLIVSYAIAIILVYLLASKMENKLTQFYRLVFPKVLVPIVIFQILSSFLRIQDVGITHDRYYVILFGVYAAASGVIMSLLSVKRNGLLAAVLIGFAIVSIVPPIDAFTISRYSQENMLRRVLRKNEMLKKDKIIANSNISDDDKKKIAIAVEYLDRMGYAEKISWLPDEFNAYEDFYDLFGFYQYDIPNKDIVNIFVSRNPNMIYDIAGYDVMARTYVNMEEIDDSIISDIEKEGSRYRLLKEKSGTFFKIILEDVNNKEVIHFDTKEIFTKYRNFSMEKTQLTKEDASFLVENEEIKMMMVVQEANMNRSADQEFYNAEVYIFIQFK